MWTKRYPESRGAEAEGIETVLNGRTEDGGSMWETEREEVSVAVEDYI